MYPLDTPWLWQPERQNVSCREKNRPMSKSLTFHETSTRRKVSECFPPACLMSSPETLNSGKPPCVMEQGKMKANLVEGEHRLMFHNSVSSPECSISVLLVIWWLIKNAESQAPPRNSKGESWLYIRKLPGWFLCHVEIKEDHPDEHKQRLIIHNWLLQRNLPPIGKDSKAGRGIGKLYRGKKRKASDVPWLEVLKVRKLKEAN